MRQISRRAKRFLWIVIVLLAIGYAVLALWVAFFAGR
jgi:hypothetical protein